MIDVEHWDYAPSVIGSLDEKWRGSTDADVRVITNKNSVGLPDWPPN